MDTHECHQGDRIARAEDDIREFGKKLNGNLERIYEKLDTLSKTVAVNKLTVGLIMAGISILMSGVVSVVVAVIVAKAVGAK
jgi:hypothetical protein